MTIKKYGEKSNKAAGDLYVDKDNGKLYTAFGNSRKDADLTEISTGSGGGKFASGIGTVVGGGGDITVTVPFDWTGGYLNVNSSRQAANYFDLGGGSYADYKTSYIALTDATYTDKQVACRQINAVIMQAKTANIYAIPKSATTTSFTLDDSGSTAYFKWFVWA